MLQAKKREEGSQLATGQSAFSSIKVSSSSIKGFTCDWMLFSFVPPVFLASLSVLQSNCKSFPRYRLPPSLQFFSSHPINFPLSTDAFSLSYSAPPPSSQIKIFNSHSSSITRNQYTKGKYRFLRWNKKVLGSRTSVTFISCAKAS